MRDRGLGHLGQQDRDPVARDQAESAERVRQPGGGRLHVGEGVLADGACLVLVDQGDGVAGLPIDGVGGDVEALGNLPAEARRDVIPGPTESPDVHYGGDGRRGRLYAVVTNRTPERIVRHTASRAGSRSLNTCPRISGGRRRPAHGLLVALLALVVVLASIAGPLSTRVAAAEDLPRLDGPITDLTDTLSSSEEAEAAEAIVDLRSAQAIDLWVLFTDTTGSLSVTDYAAEVADRNSLGTNDVLMVVAMDDRTDALWLSDGLDEISDSEVDTIISNQIEPRLADGDFVGSVEGAAGGLATAAGGR